MKLKQMSHPMWDLWRNDVPQPIAEVNSLLIPYFDIYIIKAKTESEFWGYWKRLIIQILNLEIRSFDLIDITVEVQDYLNYFYIYICKCLHDLTSHKRLAKKQDWFSRHPSDLLSRNDYENKLRKKVKRWICA